jgi:hypothetical protein
MEERLPQENQIIHKTKNVTKQTQLDLSSDPPILIAIQRLVVSTFQY